MSLVSVLFYVGNEGSFHFGNPGPENNDIFICGNTLYTAISAIIILCIIFDIRIKSYSKFRFPQGMLTGLVGINRKLYPKNRKLKFNDKRQAKKHFTL